MFIRNPDKPLSLRSSLPGPNVTLTVERWKQPCYKEKRGEMVLSAKKGSHIGNLDLDVQISSQVWESYSDKVIEGEMREKHTVYKGKWRK